jgi:hypothetical protein
MATAYPGALDTSTEQPSPASTTDLDASGYEHDVIHTNHSGALIAVETKLGLTDSNAVNGAILVGTAASTTAWTTSPAINITGNASGTAATVTTAAQPAITSVGTLTSLTVSGQIVTHLVVETDATTTHAPAVGDENKYILTTHGTGITVTLPQNSAQAFAIGTTIYYERNGAGTLTFAAGTGATVTSKDSTLTCGDRYTAVCALKIGTNAWSLIGNIG